MLWFWEAVRGFSAEDLARLIMFVTGSAKARGAEHIAGRPNTSEQHRHYVRGAARMK